MAQKKSKLFTFTTKMVFPESLQFMNSGSECFNFGSPPCSQDLSREGSRMLRYSNSASRTISMVILGRIKRATQASKANSSNSGDVVISTWRRLFKRKWRLLHNEGSCNGHPTVNIFLPLQWMAIPIAKTCPICGEVDRVRV